MSSGFRVIITNFLKRVFVERTGEGKFVQLALLFFPQLLQPP